MPNWELQHCCDHDQAVFIVTIGVSTVVILAMIVEDSAADTFQAHHGVSTRDEPCSRLQTNLSVMLRAYGCMQMKVEQHKLMVASIVSFCQLDMLLYLLPDLGSSFWGMVFILASTNLLTTKIAAGCFLLALVVALFVAKNWLLRGLCIGFIIFLAVIWLLQETTKVHILHHVILFIGVMNRLFSVYDIYDDLISRRVHSSEAEKFAEVCPCPFNGVAWGVVWGLISFTFLCASIYLGLVILS